MRCPSAAQDFGGWIGRRLAHLPPAKKRIHENLALLAPDWTPDDPRRVVREAGESLGRLAVEYNNLHRIAADPDLMRIEGGEHLTTAMAAGKGVILATAHYGNWETIRMATRRLGHDSALIYRAFDNRPFDDEAQVLTRAMGEPVWHKGAAGMRGLVRHVLKGGMVLILCDQRSTGAPQIPFLGRPAETALAPAELALKTGAALVTTRSRRSPDGHRYGVVFEPRIEAPDPLAAMTEVNARISTWIDEVPGQWFWHHRRWKSRAKPRPNDAETDPSG